MVVKTTKIPPSSKQHYTNINIEWYNGKQPLLW